MFKIALVAGHYKGTAGKRCLKALDPNETREWVLNNRIADKIEALLTAYEGYDLIRVDDTTGEKDIPLRARTNAANNFKADFYLSIHHNAAEVSAHKMYNGIKCFGGGGVVAYVYTKASKESGVWQKALYDAVIAKTGLKGNRANPLGKANFHEVRETKMPAVLLECGFMDSKTDVPIILSEDFANKVAAACVEVIVSRAGLKKKPEKTPEPVKPDGKLYRVQVGAYSSKPNAEAMQKKLKAAGFESIIKYE